MTTCRADPEGIAAIARPKDACKALIESNNAGTDMLA